MTEIPQSSGPRCVDLRFTSSDVLTQLAVSLLLDPFQLFVEMHIVIKRISAGLRCKNTYRVHPKDHRHSPHKFCLGSSLALVTRVGGPDT